MKKIIKSRPSYIVMVGSLGLLLLLIFLWIGKLYNDQINELKKTGANSLAMINNRLIEKFYNDYNTSKKEVKDSILIYSPVLGYHISAKKVELLRVNGQYDAYVDSLKEKNLKDKEHWDKRLEFMQAQAVDYSLLSDFGIFNTNTDSSFFDSLAIHYIAPKMDSAIRKEYKGSTVEIFALSDASDTTQFDGLIIARLLTSPNDHRYAFVMKNAQAAVFKVLTPQILFSVVVFICTCLAFTLTLISMSKIRAFAIMKNDFVSNMTHELKTPISTVAVALEALTNFNVMQDRTKSEEYIEISKKELNRLSILVDKVLKMTLFDDKEPELNMEPIDLKHLVISVKNSMQLLFDKVNGECSLTIEGSSFSIVGDRIHITNVIYNLIENAIKYSPAQPSVALTLSEKKNGITFSVKDEGIGIESAFQEKIFDKFFRVPNGDKHNVKGHGLGLAYVTKVIDKHKGSITLKSTKGIGSTFQIVLPTAK